MMLDISTFVFAKPEMICPQC
jgi:hypothetical protein